MKLQIVTPTKMLIQDATDSQLQVLRKILTYKNKNIEYRLKQLSRSRAPLSVIGYQRELLEKELYHTLLWVDPESGLFYTRPGLLSYIKQRFMDVEVESKIVYPEPGRLAWEELPPYQPHDAQAKAVERLLQVPHSHIEFATGTGKSFIVMLLIKNMGLPTIVTTPSVSIARQLYSTAVKLFGKKRVGLLGAGRKDLGSFILIAVGKSLSLIKEPALIEEFKKYQVFISDESHTLPASTFEYFCHTILAHCPYRWFLSGTQQRTAGDDLLLHSIIGPCVHRYTIQEAIDDGILAKLDFVMVNVRSKSLYDDPNNVVRMNQEHYYNNQTIARFIAALTYECVMQNKPVLILVDEHSQERLLHNFLRVDYAYACAGADVSKIVQDFNDGKIMCVVGTSAVSVGTDFKAVEVTINWQANRSPIKIKQGAIGRSTRVTEKKRACTVVDFCVVNVPLLRMHAMTRSKYYAEIGPIKKIDLTHL